MKYHESILELIGQTPIVKLRKIGEEFDANIFVKLEYFNPSGSIKDRMVHFLLKNLESENKLSTGSC